MLGAPILTGRLNQRSDGRRRIPPKKATNATSCKHWAICNACPSGDSRGVRIAGRAKSTSFACARIRLRRRRRQPADPAADSDNPTASQVSYQVPSAADQPKPKVSEPATAQSVYRSDDPSDPFDGQAELSVEQLVAEVQARNPSLQAASAAWRAAAERYPQAVSLDDPMFGYMIGPRGVGTDNGGGWMVEASQKIPWAGKRALRGSAASADADAMRGDIGDVRLRLSEAARTAFYDYYLARREMEVNASTRRLLDAVSRNRLEQVPGEPDDAARRASGRRRVGGARKPSNRIDSRRTRSPWRGSTRCCIARPDHPVAAAAGGDAAVPIRCRPPRRCSKRPPSRGPTCLPPRPAFAPRRRTSRWRARNTIPT